MNRHIVHLTSGPQGSQDPPAWERALEDNDFIVMRVEDAGRALSYIASYALVGLLVDAEGSAEGSLELIERLSAEDPAPSYPRIGIVCEEKSAEELEALADAGLHGFITRQTPAPFLLHTLRTTQSLQALKEFERTGADVHELARETRRLIHDLSQPLSALQGRLQLLAAKAEDDDPRKKTLHDMVGSILEATGCLRELQELHRRYS